ncbi:MAG: enoyl-CoA hydratase/isomerase family protein [Gammaproteobacteria bacterium]|nr:enoyl-CoA hydratase/isomerase family protein [Gammaproteobacteria bacterium]
MSFALRLPRVTLDMNTRTLVRLPGDRAVVQDNEGVERFQVGPLVQLVINNPDNNNAMTLSMWEALEQHIAEISRDNDIRVVVITGAGVRDFCGGHQIGKHAPIEERIAFDSTVARVYVALRALRKPTVARMQGGCFGAGFELAQACDLRIAAQSARFALSPAPNNMEERINDVHRFADRIGLSRAKDILFYGGEFSADEAMEMEFVTAVTSIDTLDVTIERRAIELIGNITLTAAVVKRAFNELFHGGRRAN